MSNDELAAEYPVNAWFCVHSQPKHEHIAAAALRQMETIQVYLPRIRFRRATRRGAVWVTEALFPNYFFARFDPRAHLRRVRATAGVRGPVQFGGRLATAPDEVIQDLRRHTGPDEICLISEEMQAGDAVQISGGVFHGLRAVVTQVIPSRLRVKVLLDFLGRATEIELAGSDVVRETFNPFLAS